MVEKIDQSKTKVGQGKIKGMRNKIGKHKTESATISLAIILAVLFFVFSIIPREVYLVLNIPNTFFFIVKCVYLSIRNLKSFEALKKRTREIIDWIDDEISQWIRKWLQITLIYPNDFFDWLLPDVNVNISCAEHHPHPILSRYGHRSVFKEKCLEHIGYFDLHFGSYYDKNRTACFFDLNGLPQRINEQSGKRCQRLRDKSVFIEHHKSNPPRNLQETNLVGWNIFGLMLKHNSDGNRTKSFGLIPTHALFMKIRNVKSPSIIKKNVKIIKRWIAYLFGVELCVRLTINKENITRANNHDYYFAIFDHRYKCMTGRSFVINEPICTLYYEQI